MTKIIGTIIAVVLFGLGLLFLMAAAKANPGPRVVVGLVAIGMGAGVAWITLARKPEVVKKVELTQKIDLSGDVNLDMMKCKNCGAELDRKSIEVRAGAVFVKCPYCGNDYQITEEPKW
jgi:Zn finger protein HypA/HybF involved in hydrogenase expression